MPDRFVFVKIASVVISSFSQILLKKSANNTYENRIREYLNIRVIVAYGLFFGSAMLGVYSLKGISISFSAILESLGYILIPFFSMLFINEKMNKTQVIGTIIIVLGIVLFNL